MQDHGVDRIGLLQLEQELLHSLDGVVAAQVDHHLFDLETYTNERFKLTLSLHNQKMYTALFIFKCLSIDRFLSFISHRCKILLINYFKTCRFQNQFKSTGAIFSFYDHHFRAPCRDTYIGQQCGITADSTQAD